MNLKWHDLKDFEIHSYDSTINWFVMANTGGKEAKRWFRTIWRVWELMGKGTRNEFQSHLDVELKIFSCIRSLEFFFIYVVVFLL